MTFMQSSALPNIVGRAGQFWSSGGRTPYIQEGCFTVTGIYGNLIGGESRNDIATIKFNASLSNEIYGKSDKVLPESFALVAQIKY